MKTRQLYLPWLHVLLWNIRKEAVFLLIKLCKHCEDAASGSRDRRAAQLAFGKHCLRVEFCRGVFVDIGDREGHLDIRACPDFLFQVAQHTPVGANYAIVGSVAAQQPMLFAEWLARFGGEKMVLGADVRNGKVSVNGWQEDLAVTIEELIDGFLPMGLNQVICTDITKDGMLQGPSDELYVDLQSRYPSVDFTVSGGIGSMADIERLNEKGLRKVIVGKAIYENRITLKDIEQWLLNA